MSYLVMSPLRYGAKGMFHCGLSAAVMHVCRVVPHSDMFATNVLV